MNKKFSTLMATGLLVLGALFSNVNAQTNAKDLDLTDPTSYEAADLNQYYYIGLADKSYYLTLDEITNTDATASSTVKGKKYNSLKGVAAASLADEGDKALFKVEVVKVSTANYFKLTNKSNGKSIQFKATDTPTATSTVAIAAGDDAGAVASYFDLIGSVDFAGASGATLIPFHGGATANTNQMKLATTAFTIESAGTALVLYIAEDTKIADADLNGMYGDGFSLKFKEMTPAINANPFTAAEKIQAVTVSGGSVPAGTYLKVAGADFATIDMTDKDEVAKFTAATFIVMDTIPLTKDGSSNFNGKKGAGYQFTTVKGADLLTIDAATGLPTKTYNKRHVNNANFAITNNVNNTDSLIVEVVKPVLGVNDKTMENQTAYGSNVRVSVINFGGQNILTTYSVADNIVPADDEWTLITLGANNIVDLKTLLKGQFINVSYVATGKEADADKYKVDGVLAVRDNAGTIEADYVAKSTVLLSSPEAQWALTNDGGLKLVNRENTTVSLTIAQLRKTAKTGVYVATTTGANDNIDGDQITISFVENHTMFDGYMTATENILRNTVYFLGQYRATADGDLNSYWAENHNASHQIGATVVKENATKWNLELVKKADKNEVDTIFVVSTMNVWANNKMTTKKDSLAILPYAYQNNGNNEYVTYKEDKLNYYICDKDNKTDAKAADRFALKMKPGNTFNYVIAEDGGVQDNVGAKKVFLSNSESKGSWDKNELYSLNNNSLMVVEKADEPEYRKVAKAWGDTISIYRQENDAQMVYEKADAKSVVDGKTLSFLNIDNVNQFDVNPALFVDTAYVNRGENTCYQYLLAVGVDKENSYYCPYNEEHNSDEWREANGGPCADAKEHRALKGRFLINLIDTANVYGDTHLHNNPYINMVEADENLAKLSFVEGIHVGDTLILTRKGGEAVKLRMDDANFNVAKFAFRYVDNEAGTFRIQTQYKEYAPGKAAEDIETSNEGYLRWVNGTVVVTNKLTNGDVFNMNEDETRTPTANEGVTASEVSVIAKDGAVIISGAQGKKVTISNVLGQTVANTVISSDKAEIAAPAGVVVVAVEGEAAVKAIVK
ncbi:hypothetical protein HMPREF1212_03759 [Parabacteroides sp. HGS0025]|uniref:DUF6383 domain-containing protein n=1 Tax=Parabacteroides sp. HGS0025 TaxID=1078087 RepID=UPI000617935C|nr:DUF6383 domain-containing protein [Parabacteroides sp. HGS0025]KKB47910.1 hypothetical protein HMPREF1212_03759 [Parabacteroides sp. HGS0025]